MSPAAVNLIQGKNCFRAANIFADGDRDVLTKSDGLQGVSKEDAAMAIVTTKNHTAATTRSNLSLVDLDSATAIRRNAMNIQ